MANDEHAQKIREFLKEFKGVVSRNGLDIVDRRKNLGALSKLGLTKKNVEDEILALSLNDYCDGPQTDTDRGGDIWVFGKTIQGQEVYIKLKLVMAGEERSAKCISFHVADHPLCFPLKEKHKKKDEKGEGDGKNGGDERCLS